MQAAMRAAIELLLAIRAWGLLDLAAHAAVTPIVLTENLAGEREDVPMSLDVFARVCVGAGTDPVAMLGMGYEKVQAESRDQESEVATDDPASPCE